MCIIKGRLGSGRIRTGAVVNLVLRVLKASSWTGPQLKGTSFFSRSEMGVEMWAKSLM